MTVGPPTGPSLLRVVQTRLTRTGDPSGSRPCEPVREPRYFPRPVVHSPRGVLLWPGKFEIYKDAKGQFRFRLKAGNGEIVATDEAYESKAGVLKGVDAVKRAAADATIEDKTGA